MGVKYSRTSDVELKSQKMKIGSYRDLEIWKNGMEIVRQIYKITENFPPKENFSLTSQMRRAAISIPSNIAEGFRRIHHSEYKQFLFISLGSSAELETQITIAKDLGYISEENEKTLLEKLNHLSRMIINLTKKL